jgi:single-strand DNA-binding protein
MAHSINKVTLLGNVGKDPEIRSFQNGGRVATFSLATSESWKDKTSGEKKIATEWHNIVVKTDGLIGIVEKYVKKGSKLLVEGKLETRKWSKDGIDRYMTEIVLSPYNGKIVFAKPLQS